MTTDSPDIAPEREPQVVHWRKPPPRAGGWRGLAGSPPPSAEAILLASIGAAALGVFAVGALAIGALAVGRLAVGRGSVQRLEIGELVVGAVNGRPLRLPWR